MEGGSQVTSESAVCLKDVPEYGAKLAGLFLTFFPLMFCTLISFIHIEQEYSTRFFLFLFLCVTVSAQSSHAISQIQRLSVCRTEDSFFFLNILTGR